MLAVAVLRLVHLLRGLQLRERRDRGLADLDRAARLAAIRQPRIPVVVEVFNRVEAGEAPRHATHRTWAVGGGRWAVGGGRWAVGVGGRGLGGCAAKFRGAWQSGRPSGTAGRLPPPTACAPEEEEASSSPWVSLKRTRTPREPRRRFVLEEFVGTGSYPPTVEDRSRLAGIVHACSSEVEENVTEISQAE